MAVFYVPPTLAADFDDFLNTDVPNQVGDYEVIHDWYERTKSGYEPKMIRGEIYPDSTKSRYENMDNQMNFRASVTSGIRKGDIIIQQDTGKIYLLDWEVALETNNAPSRALRCNFNLTIERDMPEEVDEDGYLMWEGGKKTIVDALPCNGYRYDGRPEFSTIRSTPGIAPNALSIVVVQWNTHTDDIRIGDRFVWGYETHVIVDIDLFGLSADKTSGVLRLLTRKEAGGAVD